ncbi:primosomal protein N', partial [Eubacteriales bacterium OttesenSCG-928-N13]|nr:primosomal protein N' [Eubacteriales bacterium OttesenSCG-928-N13]
AFRRGESRILVGTQMIAKGLDFPNVTLVGVVAADMSLNVPDYRSVERTFQLITQVAGRAGRADLPGKVVVQTYDPDHYGIQLAAKQDYRAFYHKEAQVRRRGLYPPFTLIARLLITSEDELLAHDTAIALETELNAYLDAEALRQDVVQMRALPAPIKRIRGEFRQMVFIKLYARGQTEQVLQFMEQQQLKPVEGAKVELEINPTNML